MNAAVNGGGYLVVFTPPHLHAMPIGHQAERRWQAPDKYAAEGRNVRGLHDGNAEFRSHIANGKRLPLMDTSSERYAESDETTAPR